MRLTLRTLLAYLDDTLEPAQARLIGQKVAESDAAQELIARINKVTRRRRLMPPPATGPGAKLDPNTLAEYLDNELSSEQLATVEEVCLESDVHLAEVAACHQILTLVLGEPAMVPPVARQRMYGLIQGREAIPYRKPPAARPLAASADRGSLSADEADEAMLGLPLSKSAPWLLPAAAVLLLAASAGAVWMALRQPQPTQVAQAPPPELEKAPLPKLVEEPEKPQPEPKPEQKPATEPPPEPDKKPAVEPKPEAPAQPEPPAGPLPPSVKRVEVGQYMYADDRPGVLLRAAGDDKAAWQRLAPGSRIATAERLVSLPGYRGEIRLDGRVHLQLWGNLPEFSQVPVVESVATLHENTAFDLDFTLERGRAVFSNQKPEGEAKVRVRFLDEVWDVTLLDPKSVVAVELVSEYDQGVPFSPKPGGEKPAAELALLVLDGQAGLKARHRLFGSLRAPTYFRWDSDKGPGDQPVTLPRTPAWWAERTPAATPFAKEMQAALGQLADRLTPKVSLDVALLELRRGTSAGGRLLALRCYAAVDDLNSLLDALSDEQYHDLRDFAIPVLRGWSGLHADHDQRLYKLLLSKNVSEAHAEIIMQLLHTFSQEQLANPHTYETLIEYLRHERLPVRELAFWHLRMLVPEWKKANYHPAGTSAERDRGYEQWKKLVPPGKLPARGKPGPGKPGG